MTNNREILVDPFALALLLALLSFGIMATARKRGGSRHQLRPTGGTRRRDRRAGRLLRRMSSSFVASSEGLG
jgi:hypothetical protein